jgi:hypothetical protein
MPVFPLRPRATAPAEELSDWRAQASLDPEAVRSWWASGSFNIGVATGVAAPAAVPLLVIDLRPAPAIDRPDGR